MSAGEPIHFVRQFNDSLHMENGMNATESANMPLTNASSRDGETERERERASESASFELIAVSSAMGLRH